MNKFPLENKKRHKRESKHYIIKFLLSTVIPSTSSWTPYPITGLKQGVFWYQSVKLGFILCIPMNVNSMQPFFIVSPQVKTVDILADATFGEVNDDLKNIKSAFLLFCQGNIVSVI